MKQVVAALLGAGERGQAYSNYSLSHPEELKIAAVIDIDGIRRKQAAEKYGIATDRCYSDLNVFLRDHIACDFVINATMDEMHYETACKLIDAGYSVLLEKPITGVKDELLDIRRRAEEKGVEVIVCHVLRYTPFYRTIKQIVESGKIGSIISMEMNEHVWIRHFLQAYVRGKWNSEKKCGSGFLLAKCCHDTDLMCWLNSKTLPKKVSSFGQRAVFIPENAPAGATEYCYDCPCELECPYSAIKAHLERDYSYYPVWERMRKPLEKITFDDRIRYLRSDLFGRCAYTLGGDIVDRQSVSVLFENGSIATLNMIGGTSNAGRWIHLCGTQGEIVGYVEENKFKLTAFDKTHENYGPKDSVVDVADQVVSNPDYTTHAGGDHALMHDLVRYFNGDRSSLSITRIDDSVNGHLIVYAAEKSRKEEKIVRLDE